MVKWMTGGMLWVGEYAVMRVWMAFVLFVLLPSLCFSQFIVVDSPQLIARLMVGDTLDNFGRCISPAGDVNSDDYDDFWVSRSSDGRWSEFRLYFGGDEIDSVPDFVLRAPSLRIYDVGDLNSDGFDDFLLACHDTVTWTPSNFDLHYGGPLLSSSPAMRFPIHSYEGFGEPIGSRHMVCAGKDMDGDGKPDLLVGEPTGNGGNGAYLYSSDPVFDTIADYHFAFGAFPDIQQSGSAVGFLPNFDGMSYILLGVPGYGGDPTTPGSVCFYRASSSLDTVPEFILHDPVDPASFAFGYQIVSTDFNQDGLTDFVVHASGTPGDLYLGEQPTDTTSDLIILPNFGGMESAGDLNTDGYSDLLICESPSRAESGSTTVVRPWMVSSI
ncbi:MAG: FG-GAP repeat protein [bacterium]|nr:FG-GAP repeat protein [bacterium]